MKTLISFALAVMVSFSLVAQAPVSLKLNLEKGKLYKMRVVNNQTIQQTYNGTPFTTEVISSMFISYKVLNQEKDVMTLEFKLDTIASKVNSPMMKRETNSAVMSKSKEPIERLMNKMSTYKIVAKLSTSGKFMGFTNYKTFRDSVMMALDSVPAGKLDMAKKQAESLLKESHVQSMIEPYFSYLPEKAVNVGEKWETTFSQVSDMVSLISFNSFTLTGIESSNANVTGQSEFEAVPSSDPNAQMSTDIKGKNTMESVVDISTGLIVKSSSKGHSEGVMTIKNQGNEMKMPMVIDSKSELYKVN